MIMLTTIPITHWQRQWIPGVINLKHLVAVIVSAGCQFCLFIDYLIYLSYGQRMVLHSLTFSLRWCNSGQQVVSRA